MGQRQDDKSKSESSSCVEGGWKEHSQCSWEEEDKNSISYLVFPQSAPANQKTKLPNYIGPTVRHNNNISMILSRNSSRRQVGGRAMFWADMINRVGLW